MSDRQTEGESKEANSVSGAAENVPNTAENMNGSVPSNLGAANLNDPVDVIIDKLLR